MTTPSINLDAVFKVYTNVHESGGRITPSPDNIQDAIKPDKVAVSDVSLSIEAGDRLGIVGRNGAGKSTLLHLIAGTSSPTSGTIKIDGHITAIMTLGLGVREEMSGRENIYLDGEINGKSRSEVDLIINEIIDFSELGKFIDYPVRTYSTGMKSRLAFSMISHIDPEILIIDEALSVGDAFFSRKATQRILDICAKGKIVILVSHSMQSIRDICNRCIWLEQGRIVADDVPDKVTNAYLDEVQARDNNELIARFHQDIGKRSFGPGWEVIDVVISAAEDDTRRARLEVGVNTKIRIFATIPTPIPEAQIRVRIVRFDQLILFDEIFDATDYAQDDGQVSLEVDLGRLILGEAIYRLDIFIERQGKSIAEASDVFEVFARYPPKGGKPMLFVPVRVKASLVHLI